MAIWIVKNSGKISYGIKRYLCDTLEDLPYSENGEVIIPGSKAYVISEKKTYMMGSDEEWHEINEGSGSGASSMSQLTDVDLTGLEDGQVLKYDVDTQTWKPDDDASATSLGNLDDVDLTNLQDGQVIKYDAQTETWVPADDSTVTTLGGLTDVDLTSVADGQVIIYDSTTEKWLASDIPSDIAELTQEQYDALPSETKNLPIIYQISDKGYFFYKGKKFRASKELTQAEYDELTPEEKNDGTEYFITDAPETVAELTQAQYNALTPDEKNNGTIWQISNKGYFYYKDKQFRASRELTQAEFDALPSSKKNDGTEYLITDATTSIGDIDDVSISGATDGQSLYYDATLGVWKNSAGKIVYAEIEGELEAGETSITLTSNYITTDSVVDAFVDDDFDGVTYDSMVITNGSVTLTFSEQATDMPVMIRVWIDGYGAANNIEIDDDHALPDAVWSGEKIQEEITNIYEQITNLYDNTATYNVGDTVIYNNTYYENITQITVPEDFDPNKWNEINLEDRIAEKVDNTEFANKYDETSSYNEGDIVIYNNKFYINVTPISAPGEAWDPTHWSPISLSDLIPDVSTKMDKNNPTGTGSVSFNRKAETTVGNYSVAEGVNATASGLASHAEGQSTTASGNQSHAEGIDTVASGVGSHAENAGTIASGEYSHAEGTTTTASGTYSHAEGAATIASGESSHAEGRNTSATRRSQHVFGEYNVTDAAGSGATRGNYVEIVGNGDSNARSNARTLDWQGNEVLAGDLTINGNTSVGQALQGIPDELSDLDNVVITSPANNQVLKYNSTTGKWENANESGGGGASDADDVSYDNTTSGLIATNVQDAIDELVSSGAKQTFIQVNTTGGTTATISDYNTFEEFKAAVTTNTILFEFYEASWHSVTSAPSGTMRVNNYFYYVGKEKTNYNYVSESGTTEGLVFIGMLNGVDTKVTSPTAPHMTNKLVKIVFEDSLVGTITELETSHDYIEVTGTLTAGSTSLTLQNAAIHTTSTIDIYTGVYTIMPTDAQTSEGQIVLTFDEQPSNLSVKVRVWN